MTPGQKLFFKRMAPQGLSFGEILRQWNEKPQDAKDAWEGDAQVSRASAPVAVEKKGRET